jgi:hypothetical protein
MKRVTTLLNLGLSLSAIFLAFFGGYFIADIGVYKAFLLGFVQGLRSECLSWRTVVEEFVFKTLDTFDRAFFSRINDPLLI